MDSLSDRILTLDYALSAQNRDESNDRFLNLDSAATFSAVAEQQNTNTKKATMSHLRLFIVFLKTKNETRLPECIHPTELDLY